MRERHCRKELNEGHGMQESAKEEAGAAAEEI
jgi:hypothetical protein